MISLIYVQYLTSSHEICSGRRPLPFHSDMRFVVAAGPSRRTLYIPGILVLSFKLRPLFDASPLRAVLLTPRTRADVKHFYTYTRKALSKSSMIMPTTEISAGGTEAAKTAPVASGKETQSEHLHNGIQTWFDPEHFVCSEFDADSYVGDLRRYVSLNFWGNTRCFSPTL